LKNFRFDQRKDLTYVPNSSLNEDKYDESKVETKSTEFDKLGHLLEPFGFKPLDVGGGGDCMFRSVSHQLFGSAGFHTTMRKKVVEHLLGLPVEACWVSSFLSLSVDLIFFQELQPFLGEVNIQAYLQEIAKEGTWVGHLELQAIVDIYNCSILVIFSNNQHTLLEPKHIISTPTPIYLGYIPGLRYVSVVELN
jgi:OTU domain-containing protein 3